jgi:ADP-heptose:LPS heptosyltransferase
MERKELNRVTLVLCDTVNYGQGLLSLKKSLAEIKPARTIFFTDIELPPQDEIEVIRISPIKSKREYSHFILKEMYKSVNTDFILVSQWDGYVLRGKSWRKEYYDYDYLGAPWIYEHNRNIANGGFSLRSRRLCEILGTDPQIEIEHPEDQSIGILYREYLEQKHGIKFPSEELADTFAFELKAPVHKTFGFHGYFHKPFQETVIIKRTGAYGDVVALEPVLHHFHKKGYKVVLDTQPQIFNLFTQHYFKVHHPEELDPRVMANARVINLDMGYEITPSQLHLKSYYEVCGIQDGEIRNPRLSLAFDHKIPEAKLFKKYVVLHIDQRPQAGRNIYGVHWVDVVRYLHTLGYSAIQIGQGEHEAVAGAIEMINMNELMLMRLIGGADAMIAIDSGPANICVALGVKLIAFFGSVEPRFIYPDLSNIEVIQHGNVCRLPKCWHTKIGTEGIECIETSEGFRTNIQMMQGMECVETQNIPPCVMFESGTVINAINKILCK